MSRTIKGKKASGYEFWSRRPGTGHGSVAKTICHRKERGQAKAAVRHGIEDVICDLAADTEELRRLERSIFGEAE